MTEELRQEESTIVQLTRMEGKIDLVMLAVKHTDNRVDQLAGENRQFRQEINDLQSKTQTLSEGAIAEDKKKIALALALKEADETRRTKSEQTWTPFQRIIVVMSGLAGAVSIFLAIFSNSQR